MTEWLGSFVTYILAHVDAHRDANEASSVKAKDAKPRPYTHKAKAMLPRPRPRPMPSTTKGWDKVNLKV